jgi:hypothetical protein
MLTWRDAEEEAELLQMEAFWAQEPSLEYTSLIEEIELSKTPLRRRLATALVHRRESTARGRIAEPGRGRLCQTLRRKGRRSLTARRPDGPRLKPRLSQGGALVY